MARVELARAAIEDIDHLAAVVSLPEGTRDRIREQTPDRVVAQCIKTRLDPGLVLERRLMDEICRRPDVIDWAR